MTKSFPVWLIAVMLLLNGLYNFYAAIQAMSFSFCFYGIVSTAGFIGLIKSKIWSQYIVYFFALAVVATVGYGIFDVTKRGWPYNDLQRTIISLMPGLFLIILAAGSCLIVFKHFKKFNK